MQNKLGLQYKYTVVQNYPDLPEERCIKQWLGGLMIKESSSP